MGRLERVFLGVDDILEDRESVRRSLIKVPDVDDRILEESTGQDGLRTVRGSKVGCRLLDDDLPDLDGKHSLWEMSEGTDHSLNEHTNPLK